MRPQADMMGGISGLPVARKMRSSSCLAERPRFGRYRQQDHPVAGRRLRHRAVRRRRDT